MSPDRDLPELTRPAPTARSGQMNVLWTCCLGVFATAAGLVTAGAAPAEPPRLVVQLIVDQLPGDVLPRLAPRLSPDGFNRFLRHGTYYSQAFHDSANTLTASGHAVLVTGAATQEHGMVGNQWFDRASRRTISCVADPGVRLLDEEGNGVSPAQLLSSTIADELVLGRPGTRAFAVAGKDRSAIIPAGRQGKAFWFSTSSGRFISSSYYFEALPDWVKTWNARRPADAFRGLTWTPLEGSTPPADANPHARMPASLGRQFPHPLVARSDALFFGLLPYTPFLDQLTLQFVRELIAQEGIGRGPGTDYLAISFSGVDYIGHAYGPRSAEYEDSLLRLDRGLAELFRHLDATVGQDRTLLALGSDHGTADIPERARQLGFPAGRIMPDAVRSTLEQRLRERFSVTRNLLAAFVPPGLYLDESAVAAAGLSIREGRQALADAARQLPGIAQAFTSDELQAGIGSATPFLAQVQRGFHPRRSGDVVLIQQQFWYMYPDAELYAAMHGSPYSYDTHVPLALAGPGIAARTLAQAVTPSQLAPSLAALLGVRPPSGCLNPRILPELLTSGSR